MFTLLTHLVLSRHDVGGVVCERGITAVAHQEAHQDQRQQQHQNARHHYGNYEEQTGVFIKGLRRNELIMQWPYFRHHLQTNIG